MDFLQVNYDKYNKIWTGQKMSSLYNMEDNSLGRILFTQMKMHPSKVIQIDDIDGKVSTNQEMLSLAIRFALYLKGRRMASEDIIGIAARNTTYLTPVVLGCLFNGTPFHAVNPNFQEASIAHCFAITKPPIIFCDGRDYKKIHTTTKSFKPEIYTISEHVEGVPTVMDLFVPNQMEYFYAPQSPTMGAEQTVAILCSSGTTGLPKAVTVAGPKLSLEYPLLNSDDVFYAASGVDWMSGLSCLLWNCYTGCTRILTSKPFSACYFVELVKKYKISSIFLAPMHVVALNECPDFRAENVSTIRAVQAGGGYVSEENFRKLQKIIPKAVIGFGYGLTEVGGIAGKYGIVHGKAVGKIIPNVQVQIVDDDGKRLGPNEVGEVVAKVPCRWAGYYGNPIETQRVMDSLGWIRTGDLGYVDDEGYMFIVDRKKDILKYRSLHYWPGEIENAIRELPEVADCCVVGIFDDRVGDVPGALVIRRKGSKLTEQQIIDHVKTRLVEPEKQLHNGVYFVDDLPQNSNGKVVKREVREIFKSLMAQNLDR
ncbi:uncharacterized protein LOC101896542 [Musca domestica]|uniref:4-coumarate--CoA ligase 1 n=1 Tax=Musca domestica TaxID=7370 RepID=A0A1I8MB79_MUSDO|nr:uncharacterized protein LOC101896542 [Musca domestica]